ncbi:MAG: RNA polymerase sigma factor [Gemmataceae bacterium]
MPDSFDNLDLIAKWRAGDQRAAQQVFDHYAERLLYLARKRISQRLASRVDAEDVVQSVFRTFFQRAKDGRFQFEEQDDLFKLLVRITVHKTLRQVEFHKAGKRDPSMETSQGDDASQHLQQFLCREPSPDTEVAFLDQLEHFLSQLDPDGRRILEMRFQGYSNDEITAKLGIIDRRIRRIIERVRGLAEQEGFGPPLAH